MAEEHKSFNWHVMSVADTASTVGTDAEVGLGAAEAARRLEEFGPNMLTEKRKKTIWERIWAQINNVLVFILIVVAVVSLIKGLTEEPAKAVTSYIEVGLIIGVIVMNTYIGIVQEGSAEKAADALKNMLSSDAKVIRDGVKKSIEATDIVPGDLVVLGLGDRVPADMRMVSVNNLACSEAALTGESVPVEKHTNAFEAKDPGSVPLGDRKNMAFSATLVSQGEGIGIAIATGDNTQIGTINALVNNVEEKKTNVQLQIDTVSKFIAGFVVITAVVTFMVGFFQTGLDPLDAVSIALVCAVAMIPEGLAAIVTLCYAHGVSKMADNNAIVRVLPAVETLGSVTVICSDKTGTLTKNEMTLVGFVTSNTRYKFDTNATERTNVNFERDDKFMDVHAQQRKKAGAIGDGSISVSMSRDKNAQRALDDLVAGAKKEIADEFNDEGDPELGGNKTKIALPRGDAPAGQGGNPDFDYLKSALATGVLCTNSVLGKNGTREGEVGNPTELAIMRAAYWTGVDIEGMRKENREITNIPFSSEYKFMATVHEPNPEIDGRGQEDKLVVHVKGATDKLIGLCKYQANMGRATSDQFVPVDRDYWLKQAGILSSYGLRVLALTKGYVSNDGSIVKGKSLKASFVREKDPWLCIIGLCAIMDPPRPECVDAIAVAHRAGVRVTMITGDHKDTALAIGEMLGLVDEKYSEGITGPELDNMSDLELRDAVLKYNIFARASPENKLQIVKALQAEDQVCSMTGDGVNDAPALKAANMGVAMGKEGTDVARESSEMILADDNFATIVEAVKEGRAVWDNLRKILFVNTPINNAQGLSVLFGMICGLDFAPLTPIQVLYCNLICAVTLGFVLAIEPAEEGIMSTPPRKVGKRLIGRFLLLRIVIGTVVLVATTVGSVFIVRSMGYEKEEEMRAQAFNTLTFGAISICLSARFNYLSSCHPRLFRGNPMSWYAVFLCAGLQFFLNYTPGINNTVFGMTGQDGIQWALVFAFMVVTFIVMESEKMVRRILKARGEDTDDFEGFTGAKEYKKNEMLPSGASKLKLTQLHSSE